jgi:hypothetical protein
MCLALAHHLQPLLLLAKLQLFPARFLKLVQRKQLLKPPKRQLAVT